MDKIVKTRKDHVCDFCQNIIPKGSKAFYAENRWGRYEGKGCEEKQIGVVYYKGWFCFGKDGDTAPICVNI